MSREPSDSAGDETTTGRGDPDHSDGIGIGDDQLPEDLQPTDDNPLAKPPDDDDGEGGLSLGPDGPGAEGAPPG